MDAGWSIVVPAATKNWASELISSIVMPSFVERNGFTAVDSRAALSS